MRPPPEMETRFFLVIRNCHTPKIDLVIKVVVVLIRRGLFRLNINKLCLVYRTYNRKFLDGCRQPTSSSSTLRVLCSRRPHYLLYRERNRRSELFETTISGSGDTLFERNRRRSELLCATSEGHFALTLAAARCSNIVYAYTEYEGTTE